MTKVIAHRGASLRAPENTMAAFRLALEQGADGVELDVQMTRDGELVVIHDETLDRTSSGSGYLFQRNYAEIKGIDAGGWFSPEFAGESIPRLSDVLDLMQGSHRTLNIELKTGMVIYDGIEQQLVSLLSRYRGIDVIISSFNHYSLRTLKSLAPELPIGALYMEGLVEPWLYAERLNAYSLHPLYINIIPELLTGCRNAGIALFPWTVDKPEDMKRMLLAKVDAVITNDPMTLLSLRRSMA